MDWQVLIDYFPLMISGLWLTFKLTFLAVVIGLLIALPLTMMKLSRVTMLRLLSESIVFFFRGTPLLVQLFLIYYGSGQFRQTLDAIGLWSYFREAFFCAVLALSLNTAAYVTEIFAGAIKHVDKKQVEAGIALGLSKWILYRIIVLPQALRIAWNSYANEIIFIMQATSLVSIITLLDLTGVAGRVVSKTFAVYEIYSVVALLYIAITYGLVFVFKRVENYLQRHEKQSAL